MFLHAIYSAGLPEISHAGLCSSHQMEADRYFERLDTVVPLVQGQGLLQESEYSECRSVVVYHVIIVAIVEEILAYGNRLPSSDCREFHNLKLCTTAYFVATLMDG